MISMKEQIESKVKTDLSWPVTKKHFKNSAILPRVLKRKQSDRKYKMYVLSSKTASYILNKAMKFKSLPN